MSCCFPSAMSEKKYHCPVEGCSFSEQKGKHFKRKMSIDQVMWINFSFDLYFHVYFNRICSNLQSPVYSPSPFIVFIFALSQLLSLLFSFPQEKNFVLHLLSPRNLFCSFIIDSSLPLYKCRMLIELFYLFFLHSIT